MGRRKNVLPLPAELITLDALGFAMENLQVQPVVDLPVP